MRRRGAWSILPRRLVRGVASSALQTLEEAGDFSVHDWLSVASLGRSLALLRGMGVDLRSVVDVGAHEGGWTTYVRTHFPGAASVMIEAHPERRSTLERYCAEHAGCRYAGMLVGRERREGVAFHLADSGSSLLDDASAGGARTVMLPMRTLDEVLDGLGVGAVDLLKLDVQGAELEVLAGARETLRRTTLVLLEVSLRRLYAGSPLAADVVRFMDERGFAVFDVCSMIRRPRDGALAQADVMFVDSRSELAGGAWA